ncbi:hypothetical protein KCP70_06450 [Salmonella enterica subsp. enterica]|nr:hypothetical protein KCP70_06450 [Salmonella enterica subsp. enterica]
MRRHYPPSPNPKTYRKRRCAGLTLRTGVGRYCHPYRYRVVSPITLRDDGDNLPKNARYQSRPLCRELIHPVTRG